MAKQKPLLSRLELALTQTSSDSEKEQIFGLSYIVATKATRLDQNHFYGKLNQNSLSLIQNRKEITSQIIDNGKKLYDYLQQNIILPQGPRISPKKLNSTIDAEFESLTRYFENE